MRSRRVCHELYHEPSGAVLGRGCAAQPGKALPARTKYFRKSKNFQMENPTRWDLLQQHKSQMTEEIPHCTPNMGDSQHPEPREMPEMGQCPQGWGFLPALSPWTFSSSAVLPIPSRGWRSPAQLARLQRVLLKGRVRAQLCYLQQPGDRQKL